MGKDDYVTYGKIKLLIKQLVNNAILEIPGVFFLGSDYSYFFLNMTMFSNKKVNFHKVIKDILKIKSQNDYYIVTLKEDYSINDTYPLLHFLESDSDSSSHDLCLNLLYKNKFDEEMLVFNQTLEWFYFESTLMTFSILIVKNEDCEKVAPRVKEFLINRDELDFEFNLMLTPHMIDLFNKYVKQNVLLK
ncbi:MAG TPA: hypothetical protein VL098_08155 [Flavipsychrobacter sp.]|nr:hypothetical protein [Flavipsychrobacter sp.]